MRSEFHQAQFESHMDDAVARCPYCKHEYQPEAEDYSEQEREEECEECGKKYFVYQSFSVDHHTRPDCELNGEQHKWDIVVNKPKYQSCDVCDKWRLTPDPSVVSESVP